MRHQTVLQTVSGLILFVSAQWAQVQPPPAAWRGAGPTPCVGSDGGVHQCPPAARVDSPRAYISTSRASS